jgi:hypothetical protein
MFDSQQMKNVFFLLNGRLAVMPTKSPGQSVFGRKRPGRDIDHSSLSGAEVKNEWRVTSTVPS